LWARIDGLSLLSLANFFHQFKRAFHASVHARADETPIMTRNDQKVGYRQPPMKTRFQPGTSGNPNGRPKSSNSMAKDLRAELDELVGNGTRSTTKQQALIRTIVNAALKGDRRATEMLLTLCARVLPKDTPLSHDEVDSRDQEIVEAAERRERNRADGRSAPDADTDPAGDGRRA
jgi:hypothetical protein